ncbi:Suppressor of cytokine signaling 3 [Larimichthys crocea]|uniref:Suppressor of cytokine signaling 3 n=1 Tax=Larimichthys crocea TaxID=215358 RepID=A0A6G0HYV1_LARCR|nr:Suppressor of cytokine signaling 3 [Larimichthys crocea]
MVTFSGRNPLAMSSVTPPEGRVQGSNFTPHHFKPFSSHAHYQQVMHALRKLQESGFYWGPVGGREASSMLRSEPPGTFLIRDSSDHHHFFTLSVQTARGTKNLRIHRGRRLLPTARPPKYPRAPTIRLCAETHSALHGQRARCWKEQRRGMWGQFRRG